MIASFSLRLGQILGMEPYLAVLAQEDLRDSSQLIPEYETVYDTTMSGPQDAAYLMGGFSGAFLNITYAGFGIFQIGRTLTYLEKENEEYIYEFSPVRAWSFGGNLRWAPAKTFSLSLRAQYGTGDSDASGSLDTSTTGNASFFTPITYASSGLVFSPQPGNVSYLELSAKLNPFGAGGIGIKSTALAPKFLVFYKNEKGSISEAGVDPDSAAGLLGFEPELALTMRVLSDLNLNVSSALFIPLSTSAGGVFAPSYVEENPFTVMVRATLSIAL
jgi:hypothetical protein